MGTQQLLVLRGTTPLNPTLFIYAEFDKTKVQLLHLCRDKIAKVKGEGAFTWSDALFFLFF